MFKFGGKSEMEKKLISIEKRLESRGITDLDLVSSVVNDLHKISNQLETQLEDSGVVWDEDIKIYCEKVGYLKALLKQTILSEYQSTHLMKQMDNFLKMCNRPEYHIALVGAIKAGKSTLINALLDEDLASTSVTPETASLTKFRSSSKANYIKIHFYTTQEWNTLWESVKDARAEVFLQEYKELKADEEKGMWLNHKVIYKEFNDLVALKEEIKVWTSSQVAAHYFVKEVEVGLVDFQMPEEVVFVDTPGLDDPVRYRSDITKEYISRANAVFVCVKSDALTGPELETLYKVFANCRFNEEKVYVIGTQIDALNNPTEDWMKQRQEWLKHLSQKECYQTKELANQNILGVASYLYNNCQRYLKFNDTSDQTQLMIAAIKFLKGQGKVDEEVTLQLIKESNIPLFKEMIQKEIIGQYKSLIKLDIKKQFDLLAEEIRYFLTEVKATEDEVLRLSEATLAELDEVLQQELEVVEATKIEVKEIEMLLNQVKILSKKQANEIYKQLKEIKF